ncbi:DUF4232 domain-containing protein [Cellulomonas sp. Sa3CUA2]|uniref:DUF4232 domain-containing protein n=1 Tax=Cellulomonas avistercoris TaxID=2762242 RepID=A0ABR8QHA3_9CELL|nr:DUF4232 domain-containing protein [Cellulomonas avistercoris]MBD7919785.1 DUF4232 domain-containing protein [Cellulomonas avistercoris]
MSSEGGPATSGPDDWVPGRRRFVVGAGLAVALLVAATVLVRVLPERAGAPGCTASGDVRPPAAVVEAVREALAAVPAEVADVAASCRLVAGARAPGPGELDLRRHPRSWVVGLDVAAPGHDGLVAAARAVLAAADPAAEHAWDLRVRDVARSAEVVLEAGGGTGLVAQAAAVRAVPGVAEVWFGPDSGRVVVGSPGDVVGVLRAAAGRALPVTTVEVPDPWVEVRQLVPDAWADEHDVALALDVATWDGVVRVLLDAGADPSSDLTVHVEDDLQRADVARRLDVLAGPPVRYHVTSPGATVDGVAGGRASDAAAGTPAAPGADVDGAPRCTGAELDVQVLGSDAALGSRFLFLRATHVGQVRCVVQGLPELAFTRASGTPTPGLTQLPDLVAPDAPPSVVLAPGESVDAQVRWAAMSTSQDPDVAVGVAVRAVPGGPVVDLPLPDALDVLAGATVKVGPWQGAGPAP